MSLVAAESASPTGTNSAELNGARESSFRLPNVRKIFIPDPGMVIVDADLAGADAQVVAWEADDAALKEAFRKGISVHLKNGEDMFGERFTKAPGHHKDPGTRKGEMYGQLKIGVHLTNYLGTARGMHLNPNVRWPLHECESFQSRWFGLHPGIRDWHKRVERDISTTRSIRNAFGYRIVYFDRIDAVLPNAVAWGPQSTVAEVCFRGALQLRRIPWVQILLQVHDSLVFQVPFHRWGEGSTVDTIKRTLTVPVPYPDPLEISWSVAGSETSWGDCK